MEYISTKEASAKWGISTTRITILANKGRIPGARRLGKSWLIPVGAVKPLSKKPGRQRAGEEDDHDFCFPLYHFRPNWSSENNLQLSKQQQSLLAAECAVLECRFADAYTILEAVRPDPGDVAAEFSYLWNSGICCAALNKPDEFSKILLRVQMLLSKDLPHRNDFAVILDYLKTYVNTLGATAWDYTCSPELHDQSLPMACMMMGFVACVRETIKPGIVDAGLLEMNLRLLKNTGAIIVTEMMHCYLMGIYYLRQNMEESEKHARSAVKIAFENEFYFPLVTFYRYFSPVLSRVLPLYPEEFQDRCHELIAEYEVNITAFLSSIDEYSIYSKLTEEEFLYAFCVLSGLNNAGISRKLGVSPQTVARRLDKICEKLDIATRKELIEYLHNKM